MMSTTPPITPLTPDQHRLAAAPIGPVLIRGGAGTGKSHTIAARIAIWLQNGTAGRITCLTHAPGAPDYILKKVHDFLEEDSFYEGLFIGTPQQLALDLLRHRGMGVLGRSADFTVWGGGEAREFIAGLLGANRSNQRDVQTDARRVLRWHWSTRAAFHDDPIPPDKPEWPEVMQLYEERKSRQNVVDQADLTHLVSLAMERSPDFRQSFAWPLCGHLLIDDLQDFTPAEYSMVKLLTGPERSVTVAANPNESVRTGEGADPRVVSLFMLEHPAVGRDSPSLRMNVRSTEAIGDAVNRLTSDPVMGHLMDERQWFLRKKNTVGGVSVSMEPPELLVFEGRTVDMCRYVLDHTKELVGQGYALRDVACIYQDASLLDHLRLLALSREVPYTVLGSEPRPRDRDVNRLIALLWCVVNPYDIASLRRAVCVDPYQDHRLLDWGVSMRLAQTTADQHVDLVQSARRYGENPMIDAELRRDLEFFVGAWTALNRLADDPATHVVDICERAVSLLEEALGTRYPLRSKAQVRKLLDEAQDRSHSRDPALYRHDPRDQLRNCLDSVNPDIYADRLSTENDDPLAQNRGITFSTVAASRGLEWPVVWGVGTSDHILPGNIPIDDRGRMEEAQRLFYIWSTRARNRLIYCHAVRSGPTGDAKPCRFLESIGDLLMHQVVSSPEPRR